MTLSVDNEAEIAWLDEALAYASAQGKPQLLAYLEAIIDDVLFEMELGASS